MTATTIVANDTHDGTFTAWKRDGVYHVARNGEVIGTRKSAREFAHAKAIRENGGDRWRIAFGNDAEALASAARGGEKRGITSFAVVIDVTAEAPVGNRWLTTTACDVVVTDANANFNALVAEVAEAGCPIPLECAEYTLGALDL